MLKSAPIVILAVLAAGCAARTVPAAAETGGIAPVLVVERFLQAVNAGDLETMARLFGTKDGSILRRDPRSEVEQRMFTIASILRHDDYAHAGERIVPGRMNEARQIVVRLQIDGRPAQVPFTVVNGGRSGWLVEQIDLEAVTFRR